MNVAMLKMDQLITGSTCRLNSGASFTLCSKPALKPPPDRLDCAVSSGVAADESLELNMRQTLLIPSTEPEMSAGGHSRPVIDISSLGRAWVVQLTISTADMKAHANPGCTTSPHAQEVGHHIQAARLQERNREDSAFTLVRILATHFKRSSLRSAGGLLSSQ